MHIYIYMKYTFVYFANQKRVSGLIFPTCFSLIFWYNMNVASLCSVVNQKVLV